MKSTSVKGTPVNRVGPSGSFIGAREGYASVPPARPAGMNGTVNKQFEGDQRFQENPKAGTPYNSELGNPDETSNTRQAHRYGVSLGAGQQDYNNPSSNGNGVVLDGMSRESGYNPREAGTADSPVPNGAPTFNTRTIAQENLAHLGQGIGAAPAQTGDDIRKIPGGVMSFED